MTEDPDAFDALAEAQRVARETRCPICLSFAHVRRTDGGELVVTLEHAERCPRDRRTPRRRR
jgi:hypothetical protein